MRKVFVWMWSALFLGGLISCVSSGDSSRWELVWEDDFNGTSFDTATWSKILNGLDICRTMRPVMRCEMVTWY